MGKYVPTPKPPVGREFVQVHTRKLDRAVAHMRMKRAGLEKVNKHANFKGGKIDSYFSQHWREVANEKLVDM